jgi:hypothetical protein
MTHSWERIKNETKTPGIAARGLQVKRTDLQDQYRKLRWTRKIADTVSLSDMV